MQTPIPFPAPEPSWPASDTPDLRVEPDGARPRSPVDVTAGVLKDRITVLILWHLFWGGKSFYRLLRNMADVGRRALSLELERLERDGLVRRERTSDRPARVEYVLTPFGESLKLVLGAMYWWGLHAPRLARRQPAGVKQPG